MFSFCISYFSTISMVTARHRLALINSSSGTANRGGFATNFLIGTFPKSLKILNFAR